MFAEKSAKTGTTGTTLTWVFSNLEGTVDVQTLANATGTTTRVFRDPYGAPIGGSNGVWSSGTGYMNKPVTASAGLTTVGARTYDPVLGKFLSVDPVIDTNLPPQNTGYTSSGNNPATYMDPSGLKFVIDRPNDGGGSKASSGAKSIKPSAGSSNKQNCKVGDWSCRVKAATPEVKCGGAGKARSCNSTGPAGIWCYSYRYDHPISSVGKFTAEQAMRAFTQNPAKIFPFGVEGCPTFSNGAECNLKTGTPLLNPNGVVGVTTTSTSVNFTVLEYGYFDAPGSTIEFSTWEDKKGNVYLSQIANGHGADLFTFTGMKVFQAARPTWDERAANLTDILETQR